MNTSNPFVRRAVALAVGTLAGVSIVGGVHAGEAVLEEVVVTGRLEESLPQTLGRQGVRVEEITSEQLEAGGYYDVTQALQALAPGMYIAPLSGAFDYVELSFQGSRPGEVLWLVDGVRINNRLYSTTTPLDTMPAHMIERIEVLEGGEGLFYGTQAVAGTVNIVTKQFSEQPDGRVSLGLDTNDGKHANGYFRTAVGGHRFVLFASKDDADGYQPFRDRDYEPSSTDRKRGYDVLNYGVKYAFDFSDDLRTSVTYQHTDATLDYARPVGIRAASNDRDEDLVTAKLDYKSGDHLQFFLKGYWHDWDTLYNEVDNGSAGPEVISQNEFWGFEDYGANLLAEFKPGGALEYVVGYDYQHYSGEDQVFLIAPLSESVHAPFAQIRTSQEFSETLRLSLGARHNDPSNGASSTVWNATGRWDASSDIFVRASLGTGFKLPDAYQLFVIDPCCEVGNPDLKPERSKFVNASVGGHYASGFGWEIVGFARDVEDVISIVSLPSGIDSLENTPGTTQVRGGELLLSMRTQAGFVGNLSYTIADAKLPGSSAQQQEVPESLAKLSLGYQPAGSPISGGVTVAHVGDIFRNGLGRRFDYGDYFVVDLDAQYRFGKEGRHRIGVRLENAFDEEYASRLRIGTNDDGDDYAYSFLGTPRTLHASYSYQF